MDWVILMLLRRPSKVPIHLLPVTHLRQLPARLLIYRIQACSPDRRHRDLLNEVHLFLPHHKIGRQNRPWWSCPVRRWHFRRRRPSMLRPATPINTSSIDRTTNIIIRPRILDITHLIIIPLAHISSPFPSSTCQNWMDTDLPHPPRHLLHPRQRLCCARSYLHPRPSHYLQGRRPLEWANLRKFIVAHAVTKQCIPPRTCTLLVLLLFTTVPIQFCVTNNKQSTKR